MIKISPYSFNPIKFKSKAPTKHTQANGDTYEIYYNEDGKIDKSYKNGEIYKSYQYGYKEPVEISYEYFRDDTSMPVQQLWHVDDKDINSVINHKDSTEHFFLRNDKNGIKSEPKLFAHIMLDPVNEVERRNIVKFDDRKNIKFDSLDEAEEYFLEEYGIDAEFDTIFQAVIFKQAVDSFEDLNYQEKGSRLFEGLVVRNNKDIFEGDDTAMAMVSCDYLINYPDEIENESDIRKKMYVIKHPEAMSIENEVLYLNPNVKYNHSEFDFENKIHYHPYRFFSSVLTHELGHWLHLKNSPLDYYLSLIDEPPSKAIKTFSEVSDYAKTDAGEFVAEYIAGRLEGNNYSKRVNKSYAQAGGPKLFD